MPPQDKPRATPKDFFLWAGAMVALYWGVFSFIGLVWDYINYTIPDPLAYYPADPYQGGISWEMATLIVLVPVFLALMRLIRHDIARDPTRKEIWVRRWAIFITLFAAGAAIVIDLIWVLYAFLNGTDLTSHFLLKALVVLLVAAVGFMHFIADLWGYWEQYPTRNKMVAVGVLALVVVTIISGFFIVGTPGQARLYRFDEQKISDLQQIQSQIVYYWQQKQKLPAKLADLDNPISNFTIPPDPQNGKSYEYLPTGSMAFELCAVFNAASRLNAKQARPVYSDLAVPDHWQHAAGRVCFERIIDPQLYPPVKNPAAVY